MARRAARRWPRRRPSSDRSRRGRPARPPGRRRGRAARGGQPARTSASPRPSRATGSRARGRTCRAPAPSTRRSGDAARPRPAVGCPGRRPSASVQTAIQGTAMIVSTSASSMQWMTIETSSRSSTSASKATSDGSRSSRSPSSRSDAPAQSGWLGRPRDDDAVPAGVRRHVLPAGDAPGHLGADRGRGRRGRTGRRCRHRRRARAGPAGRIVARVVAAAVYGYWSAPTSRPSARAASSSATASSARPHTARAPHLRCETWSRGSGDARVRGRADGRDRLLDRREHAGRLVAHVGRVQPAAPGRGRHEERHLVGSGVHPGRVDEPARQPERPGVHRRVDLADHRVALQVVRGPAIGPDDRAAHRPVPDEERDVRTERDLVDRVEVLAERPPARDQLVGAERQLDELAAAIGDRRERVAAVARTAGS